jgi:hypothetical protein
MSLFPIPVFDHYYAMWNELDPAKVRRHLDRAVTDDFIFCDPLHFHVGRDALEANVHGFRSENPKATIELGSGVDTHHNRVRYAWHIVRKTHILMRGYDVATIGADGMIERIDGFFGELPVLSVLPESPTVS